MTPSLVHHLRVTPEDVLGNQDRGRVFLIPGSPARARRIADRLEDLRTCPSPRLHDVHLGVWRDGARTVDVGTVSTGMGCPSLGIIVTELIQVGVRRFLRVGSAGSLQGDRVPPGSLVIATAAVRDEGTSDACLPREVPAVAHPDWVEALVATAREQGLAERTFAGLVHSKDSFFGREMGHGPLGDVHRRYMAALAAAGVLATEMEASHLFVLAAIHGPDVRPVGTPSCAPDVVQAGALLAVIGDEVGFVPDAHAARAEEDAVSVALEAAWRLLAREEGRTP
ncbi:MAG: uridine phosphorylase [Deltaproteobacteria bacterium]|nr:uridine phosphorylase [Deltaproteobacteria bacterium]